MSEAKFKPLRFLRKMLLFSGDGRSDPQGPARSAVDFDPCPRCGAAIKYSRDSRDGGATLRCPPCGMWVSVKVTDDQIKRCAIEQWNYLERIELDR